MKRLVPRSMWGDHVAQLHHFTERTPEGCWLYAGYILATGYGQIGRNIAPHRLAWELHNGCTVPDGLVIDHQCHNLDPECRVESECLHRRCVNPHHLEAVIQQVNITRGKGFAGVNAAKDVCSSGHPLIDDNIYYRPDRFGRLCRTCRRASGERQRFDETYRLRAAEYLRELRRKQNPVDFAIREWAIASGLECSWRGPIRKAVRAAYAAATQGGGRMTGDTTTAAA